MSSNYKQRMVVASLHRLPRFGHPDTFSSLLSTDAAERKEYTNGIIAFGVVLAVFAFIWGLALLVLKYTLKEKRVGCAAGGRVQDVSEMRANKLTRSARKKRILRNWRLQLAFLAGTLLIPALSFLLVNHGLDAFYGGLDDVQELLGSARQMAVTGIGLATDITYSQNRVSSLLKALQPDNACPNFDASGTGADLSSVFGPYNATLQRGMNEIDAFVNGRLSGMVLGLSQVSHLANYVDSTVQSTESYEWLVKGFLIALNTVNVFLFIGVCLTRCSLHHPLYQQFLSWMVVPAFCAVLCGSVVAVVVASALGVANSDFCSGGANATTSPLGSPLGTLLELFERKGYNESNLPYQALQYYGQDCLGNNPLAFIDNFKDQVEFQSYDVEDLLDDVTDKKLNISQVCGEASRAAIEATLVKLLDRMEELEMTMGTAVNLTDCSIVQPLVRGLVNGAPCSETPRGLAWLFGTTASILFVGLAMLSTRAGLYNPVIKPRRIKRREREFQEYKEYMASFYNTSGWMMDPEKKKLGSAKTFDTEQTGAGSPQSGSVSPSTTSSAASNNQSVYIEDGRSQGTGRSRFRYRDPGVVYYSSDSDDSDDESMGDLSSISSAISRIFLARKNGLDTLPPSAPSAVSAHRDPVALAKLRWLQHKPSKGDSVFQTPLETPRRSPRMEDDVRGKAVMLARESLEMLPLSPNSPDINQPPQRPHKKHKYRGRTVGGSMMADDGPK